MDDKTLHEAVENISFIKGVIDRTSKSFIPFSKIFLYWGLLFIVNNVITLLMISNKEQLLDNRYSVLIYVLPVAVTTLIAVLIYFAVAKKTPLVGLEKHLMKLWVLLLAMNVIPPKINIVYKTAAAAAADVGNVTVSFNNVSAVLFSLSIALIVTALFTGYKQLMYLGIIYIAISVFHACVPNLDIFINGLVQFLQFISLPFTFLYTGFFLRSQQVRVK